MILYHNVYACSQRQQCICPMPIPSHITNMISHATPFFHFWTKKSRNSLLLRLRILRPHPRHIRRSPRHRIRRRLLLHLLLARNTSQPVKEERTEDIEDDERPHNSEISPSSWIRRTELREKNVCVENGAEFTGARCVGVRDISAVPIDKVLHVCAACLTGGGAEFDKFNGGAFYMSVGEAGGEHAVDEVSEGGDTVHKDPETRESFGPCKDTKGMN